MPGPWQLGLIRTISWIQDWPGIVAMYERIPLLRTSLHSKKQEQSVMGWLHDVMICDEMQWDEMICSWCTCLCKSLQIFLWIGFRNRVDFSKGSLKAKCFFWIIGRFDIWSEMYVGKNMLIESQKINTSTVYKIRNAKELKNTSKS